MLRDREMHPRTDLELAISQSSTLERRVESVILTWRFSSRLSRLGADGSCAETGWCGRGPPARASSWTARCRSSCIRRRVSAASNRRGARDGGCRASSAEGVLGAVAAARAGPGLAISARSLVPSELVDLSRATGLPRLGEIDLIRLSNPRAPRGPVEALTTAILAGGDPIPTTAVRS